MRVQDQLAYVLHQRPYRDTSQILEIFTKDHGRLTVLSKGSRSQKSRLKAILQVFNPLYVSWSGTGELPVLTKAEAFNQTPPKLLGKSLPSAFYVNEILIKLLHKHDVHEEVFQLYQTTLYELTDLKQIEKTLRIFEKQFLQLLGFGLNLTTDADTGDAINEKKKYEYYVEHGPIVGNENAEQRSAFMIHGKSLIAFENDDLSDDEARKEIKSLMRYILSYYLNGKPLKSRELFR